MLKNVNHPQTHTPIAFCMTAFCLPPTIIFCTNLLSNWLWLKTPSNYLSLTPSLFIYCFIKKPDTEERILSPALGSTLLIL